MVFLAYFFEALAHVVDIGLTIYIWIVVGGAIISWVNPDPYNPVVQFLHKATEPILYPIRKLLPFSLRFGIDISPIIAFLFIYFLKLFLVSTLFDISANLGG